MVKQGVANDGDSIGVGAACRVGEIEGVVARAKVIDKAVGGASAWVTVGEVNPTCAVVVAEYAVGLNAILQ